MIRVVLAGLALFVLTPVSVMANEAATSANGQPSEDIKPPIDIIPKLEAKPEAAVKSPFEIVRSLDALQDQIVQGNVAAQRALPRVTSQIGERLLAADPQSWRQAKNARAVLTYTLSGGQARVIRKVLKIGNSPEPEKRLMEGALAYVEGQNVRASQLLLPIDTKSLPPTVGGHIALVQAMLMGREDVNRSNQFLDVARILVPGTLVEETALRREIFNLSDGGDLNKFVLLSSQYLRRFQKSPYAENFKQKFYTTVIHLGMTDNPEQFNKVVKAASELETEDQLHLYMLIAQAAILNGNAAVAHLAAEKAMEVAKAGSPDSVRARLFEAASLILTNNYDEGLAKLKELEGSQMSKQDGELKSAILSMAKQIRQWPEQPNIDEDAEPKPDPKAPGRDGTLAAAADPVIDMAQKAISDTDQLLQEHAH